MFPETRLGHAAIEKYLPDMRVLCKKAGEVIDTDGGRGDVGIQAAGPDAGREHIPDGDFLLLQGGNALQVRAGRVEAE